MMSATTLTPLDQRLAEAGLGESWYRWCDAGRDWAAEATGQYQDDSLRTEHGSFRALPVGDFVAAFERAGATTTEGSRLADPRKRSFTVTVSQGAVVADLAVVLGRGLNSMECDLQVVVDGAPAGSSERLHAAALAIRQSLGLPDPDPAYPRPIIGSLSQLEVVTRELTQTLDAVCVGWGSTS